MLNLSIANQLATQSITVQLASYVDSTLVNYSTKSYNDITMHECSYLHTFGVLR